MEWECSPESRARDRTLSGVKNNGSMGGKNLKVSHQCFRWHPCPVFAVHPFGAGLWKVDDLKQVHLSFFERWRNGRIRYAVPLKWKAVRIKPDLIPSGLDTGWPGWGKHRVPPQKVGGAAEMIGDPERDGLGKEKADG